MSENINVPNYLYGYSGIKVVKEIVTSFKILAENCYMYVETENFSLELLYDREANQYEPKQSHLKQSFLTYFSASMSIAHELQKLDRIDYSVYLEYKTDINKLIEEKPHLVL